MSVSYWQKWFVFILVSSLLLPVGVPPISMVIPRYTANNLFAGVAHAQENVLGNTLKLVVSAGKVGDGMAVDQAGNLYTASTRDYAFSKFDSNGNMMFQHAVAGGAEGQFNVPQDVAIDENDQLYVADVFNRRVQVFDASGHFVRQWTTDDLLVTNLYYRDSLLYASGSGKNAGMVHVYTKLGQFIRSFGQAESLSEARGITVDPLGNVYVCDRLNHRIVQYNPNGQFVKSWGERDQMTGKLNFPNYIAWKAPGQLVVSDVDFVSVFDTDGQYIRNVYGAKGNSNAKPLPGGVAVALEKIYVADWQKQQVYVFSDSDQLNMNPNVPVNVAGLVRLETDQTQMNVQKLSAQLIKERYYYIRDIDDSIESILFCRILKGH